ncbi:hypothetical protein [Caulobacter radicis]|uniref:hypothetical protein n=1 Tax=Caulobacter radicis TaxID=2172650 RepID=UPI001FCBDF25|nr:hypothetical protein [Caulobacter radicis]
MVTFWASLGVALFVGVLAGVLGDVGRVRPEFAVYALVAVALGVVAAMVLAFWLCVRWWRVADEAAREAHKWSWYWGGTAGLALAAVPFILLHTMPRIAEVLLPVGMSTPQAVVFGMALLGGFQLVGYGLFWAGWWLARR